MNLQSLQTLQDYQKYIREMYQERGFEGQKIEELFHFMLEEVGEFARAARKNTKVGGSKRMNKLEKEDYALEAADVFIYLLGICNTLGIDLEKAFRVKEEVNRGRKYEGCGNTIDIPSLPTLPTLVDYQRYIARAFEVRGNGDAEISFLFLWFLEELGDFAEGVRLSLKNTHAKELRLDWKAADVFIFLLQLCNVLEVNLAEEFVKKEEINNQRIWK